MTEGKAASALTLGSQGCVSTSQRLAFQVGMRLYPSVGFDNLLGKRGGRENLRNERVWVERNGRYQTLQLFGSLLRVGWRLAVLWRGLILRRDGGLRILFR